MFVCFVHFGRPRRAPDDCCEIWRERLLFREQLFFFGRYLAVNTGLDCVIRWFCFFYNPQQCLTKSFLLWRLA